MPLNVEKTVFLIDGSSFLYRAYYSMKPLHTPEGTPVHAVYGFCRMIKKVIDHFKPHYLAIAWDSKGKTERHEIYSDYKATRQAPPSDLFVQKDLIIEFTHLVGILTIAQTGIEADDLMYSAASLFAKENYSSVLITSDKDLAQALSDSIFLYDPFNDQLITPTDYEEKKSIPVKKLPFYYALLGDASDNIPGVYGIGAKTAQELVTNFDSLDDLYNRITDVTKSRTQSLLLANKDNAYLSYKLFLLTLHQLDLSLSECAFNPANWTSAEPFFKRLEFKSLLKTSFLKDDTKTLQEKCAYLEKYQLTTVTTLEQLAHALAEIKEAKAFALDTETDSTNPLDATLVGISLCTREGQAYYIPLAHQTGEAQLSTADVVTALRPYCEDPAYKKYLHNTKFDQLVLSTVGLELYGVPYDTMIAAHLVCKEWEKVGLKALSLAYFGEDMISFKEIVLEQKYPNFAYVPLQQATSYAAFDAHQTLRLQKKIAPEVHDYDLDMLYYTLELPLAQVLYRMEKRGIAINLTVLQEIDREICAELEKIYSLVMEHTQDSHPNLNINSPKQVEELLFVTLQLPTREKSAGKTGYSTRQSVLKEIEHLHPVPALIVRYRELSKLKNSYIDALPTSVNARTGRIHTTYSQTSVATGRLSSFDPNLQNIPTGSSGFGIRIRSAFIPANDNLFVAADYTQIELRVMAELSRDAALLEAFAHKKDIHALVAAEIFQTPLDTVTYEQRQVGKRVNFGLIYGQTAYGLSREIGISPKDAKSYIDRYFASYPGVKAWIEQTISETKKNGYILTMHNRRRYIPGIYEKNKNLYEEACRVAVNSIIQGSAAEIMKKGMIALDTEITSKNLSMALLLQIHDEILVEVEKQFVPDSISLIKAILENIVPSWDTSLEVSVQSGINWMDVSK